MKLIASLTSPYVRKVRIVMAEKRLDYQLELEDFWASDRILQSNPLGKVPCLVMEGGEAVFDSRVIVEYVDTLSPVGKLIPERGRERAEVRTWEALGDACSMPRCSRGSRTTGPVAPSRSAATCGWNGR
jgi:glutathione S-transferase